jgi:hypothetical protein
MFRHSFPFRPQEPGKYIRAKTINQTLSEVDRLAKTKPATGWGITGTPGGLVLRMASMLFMLAQTDNNGLTARGGASMGSGNALYVGLSQDANGTCTLLPDADKTYFTVYNFSSQAVAANAYIICLKLCGILIVIWEDCPT